MKRYIEISAIIFIALTVLTESAFAKEVRFEASIDKQKIALGERGQLGLTFYGSQDIPAPDIGDIDGLEVRYLGPSTMMTVINGRVSRSITHMYTVLPLRTGKFKLGPFSFTHRGDTYTSNAIFLEATEERIEERAGRPEETVVGDLDLGDRIFLTLNVGKSRAYVNELIPVVVKLYVARLNVRDIQLPTFDQEGFSKIEFKEPRQYRENLGGLIYDVLEFKTNVFATKAGEYRLGPAKLKCNLAIKKSLRQRPPSTMDDFFEDDFRDSFFEDFFTHYERHPIELKSQDSPLLISPLPSEGRPPGFSGAIGDYQFIFNSSPKKVRVGDPVTLNMEINGTGNFNTVLMPRLEDTAGFKVYEPQVKTETNRKTFLEVLIPENDQIQKTPRAVFSYFDPNKREYKTISQGPMPIEVEKTKGEERPQVVGPAVTSAAPRLDEEELGRDIIYIKEYPGRLVRKGDRVYKKRFFLLLVFTPLLFLISFYAVSVRRRALEKDTRYARRITAFRTAKKAFKKLRHDLNSRDAKGFYATVFETLQGYLGDRLGLAAAGITFDAVESALEFKNVDPNILRKAKTLFEICDQTRFGNFSGADEFRMRDDLKELEELMRYFERAKI